MKERRLYTYLPIENTAETEGLLSTSLAPHGWEKYRGRADIPVDASKSEVLKGLERMEPGRSRAISFMTEPIQDDAAPGVVDFAKAHALYSVPSYKELLKAGLVDTAYRIYRHRKRTQEVQDLNYRKINWKDTAPRKGGLSLSGVPHYLVVTKDGKIPKEFVRKEAADSPSVLYPNEKDKPKFAEGERTGSFFAGDKVRTFKPTGSTKTYTITSDMIPAHAAGRAVVKGLSSKTMTNADMINTQAGDPTYFSRLLQHYDKLPKTFWGIGNHSYNRKSAETYGKAMPRFEWIAGPAYYSHNTGKGYFPRDYYSNDDAAARKWDRPTNGKIWRDVSGYRSNSPFVYDAPKDSLPGLDAMHEIGGGHAADIGKIDSKSTGYHNRVITVDPAVPRMTPFTSTFGHNGLVLTEAPKNGEDELLFYNSVNWSRPREFYRGEDPYTSDELENLQAAKSFNRNRVNLKRKIQNNRDQYIKGGFDPKLLDYVVSMPDFYTDTKEDENRWIQDLTFFKDHPEFTELLGPEGRRFLPGFFDIKQHRDDLIEHINNNPVSKVKELQARGMNSLDAIDMVYPEDKTAAMVQEDENRYTGDMEELKRINSKNSIYNRHLWLRSLGANNMIMPQSGSCSWATPYIHGVHS